MVTAEVDLRQGGDVTDVQWELTQVVVGQVEAAETRKPGDKEMEEGNKMGVIKEHARIL